MQEAKRWISFLRINVPAEGGASFETSSHVLFFLLLCSPLLSSPPLLVLQLRAERFWRTEFERVIKTGCHVVTEFWEGDSQFWAEEPAFPSACSSVTLICFPSSTCAQNTLV